MRGQVKTQLKSAVHSTPAPATSMFQTRPFGTESESTFGEEHDGASLFGAYLQRRAAGFGHDVGTVRGASTSQIIQPKLRDGAQGEWGSVGQAINGSELYRENHTGLPDELKAGLESLSGLSMDDVKVHYNSSKPAQLDALAYAQGTDIHLGAGQERHLPHEAWHVVQQKQRRVPPTMRLGGRAINDDLALESEADVMGYKAQMNGVPRNGVNHSGLMGHHSTTSMGSMTHTQTPIQMVKKNNEDEVVEYLEELGEKVSDMAGDAQKVGRRFFRKSAPPKRGPLNPSKFETDYVSDRIEAQNQRLPPTKRYVQQYEAERGKLKQIGDQVSGVKKKIEKGARHLLDIPPAKRGPIEELPFQSQSFNDALEGREKGITAKEVRDERARREDEEHVRHLKYLNQEIEDAGEMLKQEEAALKEKDLISRIERFRASLAGKSPEELSRTGEHLDVNDASDPDIEDLRHILREEKIIRHVIAQKPEDQSYDTYIADLGRQADEADEARKAKKKKRKGLFKSKDEPEEVIRDEHNFGLQAMLAQIHKERIVQYLDPLINKVGASGKNIHELNRDELEKLWEYVNEQLETVAGEFDVSQLHEFKKHLESEREERDIATIVSQRGGISHLREELEAKKQKNIEDTTELFEPKPGLFGKMRNLLRSDSEKQQMADELAARVERERKEWQEIERIIKLYESRKY